MSEEQLPMIFPEPFPIPWPTGNASLLMALQESKRRKRQAARQQQAEATEVE